MKTIFITSFHSFVSKNVLNTDLLRILKEKHDLRIVIFVPIRKKDFFKKEYEYDNVFVEGIDQQKLSGSRINTLFARIAHLLVDSHYLWYKKKERLTASGKTLKACLKYFFEIVFTKVFAGGGKFTNKIFNNFFRFFYYYADENLLREYFDKYKPDILFTTDVFDESDTIFLRETKHREIFTIGMVRSWDNCYSKGILRVLPDKMIVNNETIEKEIVEIHNMPEENVFIGGLPQFDAFIKEARTSREEFFKKINTDSSKKLVVFAPAGSILSKVDWQICQIFKDAIDEGKLKDVQFLVRNHPGHPADFSKFNGNDNFILENPGKVFNKNNPKETELTNRDLGHLADTVYHADLVIWVATTLGIDALVFDKPQIVVNFDGYENKPYIESVKRYHKEGHMKKMLDLGGMTMVSNKEDLILWISKYLNDPKINSEKRKAVTKQQLWKLDGKSGERIANYILNEIEKIKKD